MIALQKRKEVALNLGDTYYSSRAIVMRCHGLGSCVALFIFDINNHNAAGAHIMLPGRFSEEPLNPTCFAYNAVHTLLMYMQMNGSCTSNLRAVLTGGARITSIPGIDIGRDNVLSVVSELGKANITITRMNTGGTSARTARFCSRTRRMQVTPIVNFADNDQNQI